MGLNLKEDGNYVLGRGAVLFKKEGEAFFRYIATTPSFNVTVATTTAQLWSHDQAVREKLRESETQREFTAAFASHDINDENLAIQFGGEVTTVEQASGAVTEEAIAAKVGGIFQLGVSVSAPDGLRDLSSVVIDDGDAVTYVEGDDYEVDLRRGLLTILSGGAIDDDGAIEAAYSHGETSYKSVVSKGLGSIRGALKFIADNGSGTDTDYLMPNVIIRADGDFSMKTEDDYQALNFAVDIQRDDDGRSIVTEGELIA